MNNQLSDEFVELSMSRAEQIANKSDFKSETYNAVLLALLLRGEPQSVPARLEPLVTRKNKQYSIGELFNEKQPGTDIERTLVAAYFLESIEGVEYFNSEDLGQCFVRAKEKPPVNINDVVNKGISRGLLMDATEKKDGKKAWMLTRTGQAFVESEGWSK